MKVEIYRTLFSLFFYYDHLTSSLTPFLTPDPFSLTLLTHLFTGSLLCDC